MRSNLKSLGALSVFAAALVCSPSAMAAPADDADSAAARGADASGSAVYDFESDNVDGELLSPEGALITGRRGSKHGSLITIRASFIAEMIKVARDI